MTGRGYSRPLLGHGHPVSWLPYELPAGDDRQVSSQDRRSVKLRVRPPPAGTHQCHRATSAGSGMMLTVKLAKTRSTQVERVGGHVDEAGGARGHEHPEHLRSPFREPLKAAKSQGGAALLSAGNRLVSPPPPHTRRGPNGCIVTRVIQN